jgi:hypothetical protein
MTMVPILMAPVVKFLASIQFKASVGFAIGEAAVGITILVLHKTRKTGPAKNATYFGLQLGLPESDLPNKTSINSLVATAYTNPTNTFTQDIPIPPHEQGGSTSSREIPLQNLGPSTSQSGPAGNWMTNQVVVDARPEKRRGRLSDNLHLTLGPLDVFSVFQKHTAVSTVLGAGFMAWVDKGIC